MKSVGDVLRECPKHDCAYVLHNGRWHRIEEHELRWLELAVMRGEVEPPRLKLNGVKARFGEDGRIEHAPNFYNDCNIYLLNAKIQIEKYKILCNTNN